MAAQPLTSSVLGMRVVVLLLLLLLGAAEASIGRTYKELSSVPVVVNNIGPLGNPAERYEYYSLPFCAPSDVHNKKENFGEVLAGDRRTTSLYDLRFRADNALVRICKFSLNQNEIKWFRDAIKQHYVFEFFVDDLPVQGFVGEKESYLQQFGPHVHNETQYFLFTHLDFAVQYNGDRVIAVKLTTDPERRVLLEFGEDIPVEFSYSVKWTETHVRYVNRMSLHSKNLISQQFVEIHWLSIINSVVLVVLLTTFLGIILMRILKKDIAGYMAADDDELATGEDEEGGWKLVHGDVFRPPAYLMLFSAAVGNGTQILTGVCGLLALSLMGTFYPGNHGTMYTAAIVLYAMTASISGYVSTRLYISLGGKSWAINVVLTACLFAMPAFAVFALNNSIALSYGSTTALPLSTILVILTLWALVTFPLTIIGAKRGQENAETYDAPCKTKHARRLIPEQPWYRSTVFQVCTAGFLPFSAIYIELHYLFATVWGHHVYTLFGILVLAFILLLIVTAFVTVALTYFQLAAEDWRWWWRSFLSGASTSLFVLGYAVFFFNYRSQMDGLMQTSFFFGYVLLISYAFALMLGTVSFFVTESFVHYLYASIKVD